MKQAKTSPGKDGLLATVNNMVQQNPESKKKKTFLCGVTTILRKSYKSSLRDVHIFAISQNLPHPSMQKIALSSSPTPPPFINYLKCRSDTNNASLWWSMKRENRVCSVVHTAKFRFSFCERIHFQPGCTISSIYSD